MRRGGFGGISCTEREDLDSFPVINPKKPKKSDKMNMLAGHYLSLTFSLPGGRGDKQ